MHRYVVRTAAISMLLASAVSRHAAHAQSAVTAVRDSAGIRIVSHSGSARPQSRWRIGPEPLLEIGGENSAGPTLFNDIWGAARTIRGDIVVSDNATQELRMFDSNGRHLRSFGRRGDGPGEFWQIKRVYVRGDTVLAIDTQRGTALFTLDGKLIRQRQQPFVKGFMADGGWGVLRDGSVIVTASGPSAANLSRFVGTFTELRGLLRISPDGRSATLLREVPTFDYYRASGDASYSRLTFAPTLSVAISDNNVCFGRGETYEVHCISREGALTMILRQNVPLSPVTSDAKAHYRERVRTQRPTPGHRAIPQAQLDAQAASAQFAATFPAYDRIVAGVNGEIWVSEYKYQSRTRPMGEQAPRDDVTRWNVFSRDGAWTATIALPTRFSIKEVGADYLLGVSFDDDGVERVTMYGLQRGASSLSR